MIPTIEQFNQLTQNEKIKLIQQSAPHLLSLLKKSLSSLSSQELSSLFEFANFEAAAKEMVASFTSDLTNFLTNLPNIIEKYFHLVKLFFYLILLNYISIKINLN